VACGALSEPDVKERHGDSQPETDQNAAQKTSAELIHVRIPGFCRPHAAAAKAAVYHFRQPSPAPIWRYRRGATGIN